MSSTDNLTEDQKNFLQSLEEEFKDRYTENDKEFKAVLERQLPHPPVIMVCGGFRQNDDRREQRRDRWNRDRDSPYGNRFRDNQYFRGRHNDYRNRSDRHRERYSDRYHY